MTRMQATLTLLHHAVQEHADDDTRLGASVAGEPFDFFHERAGWLWPDEYRALLRAHDGFLVADVELYSFLQSFELFLLLRSELERQDLWPVASDGCGNYFGIPLRSNGAGTYFLEASNGYEPEPAATPVPLCDWLIENLQRACKRNGCSYYVQVAGA